MQRALVVGASLAGLRAAEALRRGGFGGQLDIVGAEAQFPLYDRPQLSKAVLTGVPEAEITLLRMSLEVDAELWLGRRATGLDATNQTVLLDDSKLDYDGLVIATGAAPRRLPAFDGLPGAHTLRTLGDARALRLDLRPGRRVAVIGAGVLGCEVAASCATIDCGVTMIDMCEQPMPRVVGPSVGRFVAELHRDHGVQLALGRSVTTTQLDADRFVIGLDDGTTVDADVVVVAIGATPSTEWLAGSELTIDDGVLCDDCCFAEGSRRTIVAAGDVARVVHPVLGTAIRVEHWTNAVAQGQAAGRNLAASLAGEPAHSFSDLPYFWTDQFDWRLQMVGRPGPVAAIEEGDPAKGRFVATFHAKDRLVGAACVNMPQRLGVWRRAIVAAAAGN